MAAKELPEMPAGPILELHGQRKRFHIPQGLKLLLEEASREVLREQPENIYQFLADFIDDKILRRDFNTLMGTKKDSRRKSWEWRRWSWDGSSLLTQDELLQFLSEFHISIEVAEHLATIIQSAYRGFLARQEVKLKREGKERRRESLWDEWRHEGNMFVSPRDVEEILAYYGITLFEANAFATKIQAVFRGHFHRKSLKKANPELAAHLNALGITHWEASQKATKIQSLFRGYKARKKVQGMRDQAQKNKEKLDDSDLMGEDYYSKEFGGEDYGRPGSMAQAKTRYKKSSRQHGYDEDEQKLTKEKASAKTKIQAADLGLSEGDEDEDEADEDEGDYVDPANPKPKYDAYFPGGYVKPVVVDGVEVPPPFQHEHFGEIDPAAVREKFSTHDFKQRMSQLFKELDETKEDRKREIELQKVLSKDKVPGEAPGSRKVSVEQAKSGSESRKGSLEQQAAAAAGSRQPSLDQGRKASDPAPAQPQGQESRKTSLEQGRKASDPAPAQPQGQESRKTSLEQGRKASDPAPAQTQGQESRKTSLEQGRKPSDPQPVAAPGSRKSSKEEERKASLEQPRKASDPKPAEGQSDKTAVTRKEYTRIKDDRKISDDTSESINKLLNDTVSIRSGQPMSGGSVMSTASSGTRAANRIADEALQSAAATKIQSNVRGMQSRSKTDPLLRAARSGDPAAAGSGNSAGNPSSKTRGASASASSADPGVENRFSGDPGSSGSEAGPSGTVAGSASHPVENGFQDDNPEETAVAIKIQSKIRGHQTRSMLNASKTDAANPTTSTNSVGNTQGGENVHSDDVKDAAATKIQSRVRGMQARSRTTSLIKAAKGDPYPVWIPTPFPTPDQYRSRSRAESLYQPEIGPLSHHEGPEVPDVPDAEDEADEDLQTMANDAARFAALEKIVASQRGSLFLDSYSGYLELGLSDEEAMVNALEDQTRVMEANNSPSQMQMENARILGDSAIQDQAATKIQARVRGMQTRAHLHARDDEKPGPSKTSEPSEVQRSSDPEVEDESEQVVRPQTRFASMIATRYDDDPGAGLSGASGRGISGGSTDSFLEIIPGASSRKAKKPILSQERDSAFPPKKTKKESLKGEDEPKPEVSAKQRLSSFTQELLDMGYYNQNKATVHNERMLPRDPTATYKLFPAGARASALDNYLQPVPAPNTIYASKPPRPEWIPEDYDGPIEDDSDTQQTSGKPPLDLEDWKRRVDELVADVEERLAKKHQLPYPYKPRPPHPLEQVPISRANDNETTIANHVDQLLERAVGAAGALDTVKARASLVADPARVGNDAEDLTESRPGQKSVGFKDVPEEQAQTSPNVQLQSQSQVPVSVPKTAAHKTDDARGRSVKAGETSAKINLESMVSELNEQISEEWLDLKFLGIEGDWSLRVGEFLDTQLDIISGVITGEIPASEAPIQTIGLSVAFLVGMGAGYALLSAVFNRDSEPARVSVPATITPIARTGDAIGIVASAATDGGSRAAAGAEDVCRL